MDKKPDNVVFNEEKQKYDAHLKPYATDLSAPVIHVPNVLSWKKNNIHSANANFKASFDEIKSRYKELLEIYEYNNLIYGAKFNFKPILGEVYHLYTGKDGLFLSILSPNECSFSHVGSFKLNTDKVWEKI